MDTRVRLATESDVDALAELSRRSRRRLATWEPQWWAPAADADALHPLWLGHLITTSGPIVRVAEVDGKVVGGAVAMPQRGQWFVDDLVVDSDGHWFGPGLALLDSFKQRPALTVAAAADVARRAAASAAGLGLVSRYWIGALARESVSVFDPPPDVEVPPGSAPPARHTFNPPLDPKADGALVVVSPSGGLLVGSPSVKAPPVYDPGGRVVVIDRVTGAGSPRRALLGTGLAQAALRGDVLAAVVVSAGDDDLAAACASFDLHPAVDVLAWP